MLWSKKCIISAISIVSRVPPYADANLPVQEVAAVKLTSVIFQVNNAKLYVPVFTLFINDNTKFLENIKQGFKRTISWNNTTKITIQSKNNNFDYLIDLTFRNINRLFALSLKSGNENPTRDSFNKYYMSLV